MKRSLYILSMAVVFIFAAVFSASAVDLPDGTYEVAVTLLHAEKDKTSMGNKYIAQTALLEVENGKKYLTVVLSGDIDNMRFWYYNDGTVSGDSTEAEKTESVAINGRTYSVGYRFPVVSDSDAVGVRFKAPVMPLSPSARVMVDYGSAQARTSSAETTVTSLWQTATEIASTEIVREKTTVDATTDTAQSTTRVDPSTEKPTAKRNRLPITLIFPLTVCIIFGCALIKERR